jgi:adenylosuccinate synthase
MADIFVVAGLFYGDEAKGSITEYITDVTGIQANVWYNGGSQTAHNVVRNGITHCFSQICSGSFSKGVKTYISKFKLVDPLTYMVESEILKEKGILDIENRTYVDPECIIITPMHKLVGQMREEIARNGSCGMGVGEALTDSNIGIPIKASDLLDKNTLIGKLEFLWRIKLDQAEQLVEGNMENCFLQERYHKINNKTLIHTTADKYIRFIQMVNLGKWEMTDSVFEGGQGVLLDPEYGFWPHVTKTRTTFKNADDLISSNNNAMRIGVMRAYGTRHGNGPFVTEDASLSKILTEKHNKTNNGQGNFRVGWPDMVALRYSCDLLDDLDYLAVTCMDRISDIGNIKVCIAYEYQGTTTLDNLFIYESIGNKKIITRIIKPENPTHERQIKVKDVLKDCLPIYCGQPFNGYIDFLEAYLHYPVKIVSYGPESKDKMIINGKM